jgi:acyl-CoA dehydrogenase
MNGSHEELTETATRLFAAQPREGGLFAHLWGMLEDANLTLVSVPERYGGAGRTLKDAAAVLRLAGRYAVPAPLTETGLLAGWALAAYGLPIPDGPLAAAPVHPGERIQLVRGAGGWLLSGSAQRVPWANTASRVVVVGGTTEETLVTLVDPASCDTSTGENLASEPRNDLVFDGVRVDAGEVAPAGVNEEALLLRGALARSVSMAGALESVLGLSLRHAEERYQFGRPISRFQAIQQQLALLAGEVAAANAAVEAAVEATELAGTVTDAAFEIAATKVRVGEAAGTAAAIAHQVHGAIGFTKRHTLRHFTLRLWSWRDEFGTESEWASRLGNIFTKRCAEALWPTITSPPPSLAPSSSRL